MSDIGKALENMRNKSFKEGTALSRDQEFQKQIPGLNYVWQQEEKTITATQKILPEKTPVCEN